MRNVENLISSSRHVLESVPEPQYSRYPYGILIEARDTAGVGDGLRRQWLDVMVTHYFAIFADDDPSTADAFWTYSDDSKTSIVPRTFSDMPTQQIRNRMKASLRACGRLIGIALRYGIVPGIRLSPAVIGLLQRPGDDFDIDEMSRSEDFVYYTNIEKLRDIDWENPDEVERTFGDDQIPTVEGVRAPITRHNVDEYIRRKHFKKVVWSILGEVGILRKGVTDMARR